MWSKGAPKFDKEDFKDATRRSGCISLGLHRKPAKHYTLVTQGFINDRLDGTWALLTSSLYSPLHVTFICLQRDFKEQVQPWFMMESSLLAISHCWTLSTKRHEQGQKIWKLESGHAVQHWHHTCQETPAGTGNLSRGISWLQVRLSHTQCRK